MRTLTARARNVRLDDLNVVLANRAVQAVHRILVQTARMALYKHYDVREECYL